MLNYYNNYYTINVRTTSLQTGEVSMKNNYDFLALVTFKSVWIYKQEPISEKITLDIGCICCLVTLKNMQIDR